VSGFLLDTNVVSELIQPQPEPKVTAWIESTDESLLYLSVLTIGEIQKGIAALAPSARRARLETWLETDLHVRFAHRILAIEESVARRWGALAAQSEARGAPLPVIDGLLAATAVHHDLILVTRNSQDFVLTGVAVFSPWEE
jgi:predicted nucleic acid-binding protein